MRCEDYIHFHTLLESVRDYRGVTIEQLCAGLCSVSQMHYIQRGERLPDYQMRNRIMGRLGISSEGFEDYVQYDEYERWCQQQELLILIEDSKWDEAEEALASIKKSWKRVNNIEEQFLLDIQARLSIHKDEDEEKICDIYEKIVNLSILDKGGKISNNMLLSPVEYYYLIGWLGYKARIEEDDRQEIVKLFEKVLRSIVISPLEGIARAKVLPYAVVQFYEAIDDSPEEVKILWKYSCDAIKALKAAERSYYLKELVDVRQDISTNNNIKEDLSLENEVVSIIEDIEDRFFEEIPMWQNGYIYRNSQVCCISEVIHDRRRMMGLTRSQLAEDICSERTLERIEANHSKPQKFVLKGLFERLNLVGDYRRAEIITDDIKLINIFNEYKKAVNQKKYEEAMDKSEQVIRRLEDSYVSNQQTIIRLNNVNDFFAKKIDREEFIENLQMALKLSVNDDISDMDFYYMTIGEMVILYNIAIQKNEEWQRAVLDKCLEKSKEYLIYSFFSIYELVKDWEASSLGNNGYFDESNEISTRIITSSLRLCKIHGLYRALSNIAWNEKEQNKDNDLNSSYIEMLNQCITLCDFSSNKLAEVYRKELK